MNLLNFDEPHRRWNPLIREWVLVSPQRTQRPWHGQVEKPPVLVAATYDPHCYLCPGNSRAGEHKNPNYDSIFIFENDFAALVPEVTTGESNQSDLIMATAERGTCRVLCFSPRHDLTISNMELADVTKVAEAWRKQYVELGAMEWVRYVEIFENRGEMMGASNPHPHCQIWANQTIPNYPLREQMAQLEFLRDREHCLLCEYLNLENGNAERIVCRNDFFTVLVPFWAVWPFETLVLANEHITGMDQLNANTQAALADILKRITARYDNVFSAPFPYSMGFHQRPTDGEKHEEWHFHAHYYPPLLRSATVRKFMVGYEMLAGPQRDITPESAARTLRELREIARNNLSESSRG